jgi:error-prone DNA polymerase
LALFAAAAVREADEAAITEQAEPTMILRPMTSGREVVEDYVHMGLSLRAHPVSFLREEFLRRKIVTCAQAMRAPDNKWLETAGIVLVRQKPGSAKGVIFITIEDETGIANLVIWPDLYEKQRRVILSSGMMAVYGRVQREGEAVHLIAHRLTDLSAELATVGDRDGAFPPQSRGDQAKTGGGPNARETLGRNAREIYVSDHRTETITVKARDFR